MTTGMTAMDSAETDAPANIVDIAAGSEEFGLLVPEGTLRGGLGGALGAVAAWTVLSRLRLSLTMEGLNIELSTRPSILVAGLGASVAVIDDLSASSMAPVAALLDDFGDRFDFIHASVLEPRALAAAVSGASTSVIVRPPSGAAPCVTSIRPLPPRSPGSSPSCR